MNVVGLYGAIGWNVVISDNPKLLKQSKTSNARGLSGNFGNGFGVVFF